MRFIRGSLDQLQPLVEVSIAAFGTHGVRRTCTALIDTGATRTCITPRVIQALDLPPRGKLLVASATSYPERRRAHGYSLGLFCASIAGDRTLYVLPDEFIAPSFQDNHNSDVLLGMDLLSRGRLVFERSGDFEFSFEL